MSVESFLESGVKARREGFDARLRTLTHTWRVDGVEATAHFFYVAFRDGQPALSEFVDYLYHEIVPFCIPRRAIEEASRRFKDSGHPRHIQELVDQARYLFLRAKANATRKGTQGEPAELVLFRLLECVLNAPQIACKMYLKTSENMPVHGSDSIHIGGGANALVLHWGESKLYQQPSSAIDDAIESITSFTAQVGGRAPRERDLAILRDHIDITDADLKAALLEYFDPYSELSNTVSEAYACFIGFDTPLFANVASVDKAERVAVFERNCRARLEEVAELFAEKVKKSAVSHLTFNLFLIPFADINDFRKQFYAKLGVQG